MSQRMLDLLIKQWPGKTHLTAEQTATVLNQNPYTVRERMRNGSLPGAQKNNGIWEIALPDLAEIREPTNAPPPIPQPPVRATGARRRRAVVMNYHRDRFWAQVARALGDIDTADALDQAAQAQYDQAVEEYLTQRAQRRKSLLAALAAETRSPVVPSESPGDL